MKDASQKVLYIGKAKNLKTRVRQYFVSGRDEREMVPFLVAKIADIETISTFSEKEALLLENTLIKKHKPPYNVLLKDDKTYISLKINHKHKWPMIRLVRYRGKPKKDGLYFGPYTSAWAARHTLNLMQKIFPLRQCSDRELKARTRPCLLYGIKRCVAPCVDKCTQEDYSRLVEKATNFLKGQDQEVKRDLVSDMEKASEQMNFERANELLHTLRQIERITGEGQALIHSQDKDCDALGLYRLGARVVIVLLLFRSGKLIGKEAFNFGTVAGTDEDILSSFTLQHYQNSEPPAEILMPLSLDLSSVVGARFICPQKGNKKKLVQLAEKNAKDQFEQEISEQTILEERLLKLEETLSLTRCPVRIECFDTAHLSGSDPVACMITFTDGKKDKKRTRLFKIKEAAPGDDYGALKEVLTRRYVRAKKEDDLPDLVIVDGGKGQLGILEEVFKELDIASIDQAAITKEEGRHDKGLTAERVFLPERSEPIILDKRSPLLFFLQQIRDESHRVAIGFHRKKRSKRLIKSQLDDLPGIGPVKKKRLLLAFKSVEGIKKASPEELLKVEGITKKDIETLSKL